MIGHRQFGAQDYWQMLLRRRRYVIVPAVAIPVLALALTYVLPSRWKSKSLILIEHQRVPSDIVQPVVTENLNARLATMQERVLSNSRLEKLVKKYHLFQSYVGRESPSQIADRLRKAITLTAIKPAISSQGARQSLPGFSIAVELDNPHVAQQVCASITSMFIDENLRQRERATRATTNFLQSQLNSAKEALNHEDAKLAAFKEKYFGMLPDDTQANLNVLSTLNTQLETVASQLTRTEQDKTYAESLLNQELATDQSEAHELSGGVPQSTLSQQIASLQSRLDSMKGAYTNDYPDVVRLKQEIKNLKSQLQANLQGASAKPAAKAKTNVIQEPRQVAQLRSQIQADDQAIQQTSGEENRIQRRIKYYESRLQLSPKVESEYKEITRNHKTALKVYNDLLQKRDESQMAMDLELAQQGEQFILMDPASFPQTPAFPNRKLFGGLGLGLGLVLGCALAFLMEMRDLAMWNEMDVQAVLGVYPVARIPLFETEKGGQEVGVVHVVPDAPTRDTVTRV